MATIFGISHSPGIWQAVGIAVPGAMAIGLLLLARRRMLGTTMLAPWAWLLGAVGAVVLVELASEIFTPSGGRSASWVDPLRSAAAVGMVCPVVSSLGAKRPQSGAWQFVVLSLWAVLALPAAQEVLLARSAHFQLPQPLAVLAVAIVLLGLADRLMTRFGWAALLLSAAQLALLSEQVSWLPRPAGGLGTVVGLALVCVSCGTALLAPAASRKGRQPYDRLWLEVRDTVGLLWSLRLAERFNASAESAQWPVRLGWQGFQPVESQHSGGGSEMLQSLVVPAEAAATFTALLRRFVSRDWIAARLKPNV